MVAVPDHHGEHHVNLWISWCGKSVPSITRSFTVHSSTSFFLFSFLVAHPCFSIALSECVLSFLTLPFYVTHHNSAGHDVLLHLLQPAASHKMHPLLLYHSRWLVHSTVNFPCLPLTLGFHSIGHFSLPFFRMIATSLWCWLSSFPNTEMFPHTVLAVP